MKTNSSRSCGNLAFTRLDLAMVLAALGLLSGIAWPVLAGNKQRSEQVSCLGNLRQIGRAVQLWGNDHEDRTPWFTPVVDGGTRESPDPLKNSAFFQMGALSNELVTPKMLVCPSDVGVGAPRKMASNFSAADPNGGFFTLGYRNASLSYTIDLHSYFWLPRYVLSGDRNIRWDNVGVTCVLGVGGATMADGSPHYVDIYWTNSIHGETGNILYTDGSVEQLSTTGLRRAIGSPYPDDNCVYHFMSP